MGYSSLLEVDLILANALTTGRPEQQSGQFTKLIGIGGIGAIRDTNRIPNETVENYISYADSEIDGICSQIYYTPFSKCANGQWLLDEDINVPVVGGSSGDSAGNQTTTTGTTNTVVVNNSYNLVPGDECVIHDDLTGLEEVLFVATLVDQHTFTAENLIEGSYVADGNVRVIRVQFPPPLNQISARLAAAAIYDKFFAAQAQPDVSDYGKEMRKMAYGQLNDILNGRIVLKCGKRRGDLFGNAYLDCTPFLRDRGFNSNERNKSSP